jgi:hypothetical protein
MLGWGGGEGSRGHPGRSLHCLIAAVAERMLLTEVVMLGKEVAGSMEGQEEKVREKAFLLCREYLQVSHTYLTLLKLINLPTVKFS